MNARAFALASLLTCAFLASSAPARADWPAFGRPVCVATGSQVSPSAIPDGAGGVFVAWEDTRLSYSDIWCQRLTRAGVPYPGWPEGGIPVCTADPSQIGPRLCPDGAGGIFIAWTDQTGGVAQSDVFMQRVTGFGAIAPGWPLSSSRGLAVATATRKQYSPVLAPDGTGGVYVAWTDYRDGANLASVALSHFLADGTLASGWPANGIEMYFDGYNQTQPVVAPDGVGGCFIVFPDGRGSSTGTGVDLYMVRFGGDAQVPDGYLPSGNPVMVVGQGQDNPRLVADGAGGVYMAWNDYRASVYGDPYLARIDASGLQHAGWAPAGLPLSTAAASQDNTDIALDGAGGVFAVWRDSRTSPTYRIYATRATTDGAIAPGWPSAAAGGLQVCNVAMDQQQQSVVGDGSGGAIIAWRDSRNASTDIYATHLTSTGALAPGWPAEGVGVCTMGNSQWQPVLASDGAGGAFVFWNDARFDVGDLFATHLTASGDAAPVTAVTPVAARFSLALSSANPARGRVSLSLTLAEDAPVSMDVLDLSGRRVRSLLAGETLTAGPHALEWDGRDDAGREVATGLYFVSARGAGEQRVVRIARAD